MDLQFSLESPQKPILSFGDFFYTLFAPHYQCFHNLPLYCGISFVFDFIL
jgi:hypothetical protein